MADRDLELGVNVELAWCHCTCNSLGQNLNITMQVVKVFQ